MRGGVSGEDFGDCRAPSFSSTLLVFVSFSLYGVGGYIPVLGTDYGNGVLLALR
jgi:hypothetical protein